MAIFATKHVHNLTFAKGCILGPFPDKDSARPGCISQEDTEA